MIIEAGNGDPKILVVKLCEQLRQNRERIRDRTAEDTRVGDRAPGRSARFDNNSIPASRTLWKGLLSQASKYRRLPARRPSAFLVVLDVIPETYAADFFFAFNQDLHVDGKLAAYFLEGFECFEVNVDLALSSAVPRPKRLPLRTAGSNGGEVQRSRGSAG